MKECSRCHIEKSLDSFAQNKTSRDGFQYQCKGCMSIHSARRREKFDGYNAPKEEYKAARKIFENSLKGKYGRYKSNALQRMLPFELTLEEFKTFWQKSCSYCGDNIPTIGLDRLDNFKGYTFTNIISCCEMCNRSKHILTSDDFVKMCTKVADHSKILEKK
jgi:hypothetical protein